MLFKISCFLAHFTSITYTFCCSSIEMCQCCKTSKETFYLLSIIENKKATFDSRILKHNSHFQQHVDRCQTKETHISVHA